MAEQSGISKQRRALVVEDSQDISRLVKLHLRDVNIEADVANCGTSGLKFLETRAYDLVILDLMLPGVDGLELCRRIRSSSKYIPVLMLTAKSSELDRVLGLELGADDYITKPFSFVELMARVKAVLRRVDALSQATPNRSKEKHLKRGDLAIEIEKRKVVLGDKEVELTAKEFDLLVHFAQHPGRVYNRSELLDQVWGYGHDGYQHTVNSHINRLRAKIETDPANPRYILTVWGVGYKFAELEA